MGSDKVANIEAQIKQAKENIEVVRKRGKMSGSHDSSTKYTIDSYKERIAMLQKQLKEAKAEARKKKK